MFNRRSIKIGGGWKALLRELLLRPIVGGLNPLAWGRVSRARTDEVHELRYAARLADCDEQAVAAGFAEVIVPIGPLAAGPTPLTGKSARYRWTGGDR